MTTRKDNIIKFPGEDISIIEADAARWLARVTSGSMSVGELAEFELWRASSREHDRVFRELEALWEGMALLGRSAGKEKSQSTVARFFSHRLTWQRLGQVAAAIVCAIALSQYVTTWRYDFHTGTGQTRQVPLADGSLVYMGGNTAMNIHVSGTGVRRVELARGEAFFDVRHDDARPFTVEVGSGEVRDIGTAFSVSRNGKSSAVAVEEGIVAVSAAGQYDLLHRGEQVTFDRYAMSRKSAIDTADISPWRRGLYIADDKSLAEVLTDLDAYYPQKILMIDHALGTRRVNVVVQLDHIDDWLRALNETAGVSVRRYGPVTVVGAR